MVPQHVALVTGASRGIGAACARRLARDGMHVALACFPSAPMIALAEQVAQDIRDQGGKAFVVPADLADMAAITDMIEVSETALGRIDRLVLNAADDQRKPWTEISEQDWDSMSTVNLKAAFFCCQKIFGNFGSESGAIVTISSVLAKLGSAASINYGTTKAGLVGLTRSLARVLGPQSVRVNCIMLGSIQTEREIEVFPNQVGLDQKILPQQCIQRRGTSDDAAGAVSFLVGEDSTFITGQTLCVDGGWVLA